MVCYIYSKKNTINRATYSILLLPVTFITVESYQFQFHKVGATIYAKRLVGMARPLQN
jgi:hypothetical protein